MNEAVPADLNAILKLEVPVIVQIGQRAMTVRDVVGLVPGSIVEIPKTADEELEILINNKTIGTGRAVKVGEHFGIRVEYVGDAAERLAAMAGRPAENDSEGDLSNLAEQLLGGH